MNSYSQTNDKTIEIDSKVLFKDNKGFSFRIEYVERYPIHMHKNVTEIILAIKGSINVTMNRENIYVKEGDFVFINHDSLHSIQSPDGAIIAAFYIDLNYYEKRYEYIKSMYFRNNMYSENYETIKSDNYDYEKTESKSMFKNKLIGILINTAYNLEFSDQISSLYISQIIDSMIEEFNWLQFLNPDKINQNQIERYYRIVKYIQENITERITLDDITSLEYISKNYFSHFWKDISDFSFMDRVHFEKVLKSEHLLLTTNENIVTISDQLGFSDVKYYYNHFKKWYGCTPLQHRNRCLKYMKLEMNNYTLTNDKVKEVFDDYLKLYSLSPKKSLDESLDNSSPLIRQLFALNKNYFSKNNMSIILDLYNLVKANNGTVEINRHMVYQIILLTAAKDLELTVKIDCSYINREYFFNILDSFFQFSLFHFGENIIEGWDYFIKYDEKVSFKQIKKIQEIVKNNVNNANFKFYLEV